MHFRGRLAALSLTTIQLRHCNHSLCCRSVMSDFFTTSWTLAHQAPLFMEFSRQEYWSGFPFPPPEDLPDPGIKPVSPASPVLAGKFFTTVPPGKLQPTSADTIFKWNISAIKFTHRILESYLFFLLNSTFSTSSFNFSRESFLFFLWNVLFWFCPLKWNLSSKSYKQSHLLQCIFKCFIERSRKTLLLFP